MLLELLAVKEINKSPEIPQPKPTTTIKVEKKQKPKTIKPKKYIVKQNDTLTKIAKKHKTSWQRIFYKNKSIKDPDSIKVGVVIYMPSKNEKLKKRTFYHPEPKQAVETIKRGSGNAIAGNMYESGQCTWHVKNNISWVGNDWGDASSWSYNAGLDGYATHAAPKAGAVAWRSGHVGYVLDVKAGQVLISEMNYNWTPYAQREVWVDVSAYQYIY